MRDWTCEIVTSKPLLSVDDFGYASSSFLKRHPGCSRNGICSQSVVAFAKPMALRSTSRTRITGFHFDIVVLHDALSLTAFRLLVALLGGRDLLLFAKHLFSAA